MYWMRIGNCSSLKMTSQYRENWQRDQQLPPFAPWVADGRCSRSVPEAVASASVVWPSFSLHRSRLNMIVKSFAFLLIFSIALALAGCKDEAQDPRTQPPLVRLARVGSSATSDPAFTGVVTCRVQSDLGFRVSGKVILRYVDTGQVVRKGQPLMEIDVTDYAHAITNQTQTVAAAKARADQAVADEVRYRGLVSTGAVSAST